MKQELMIPQHSAAHRSRGPRPWWMPPALLLLVAALVATAVVPTSTGCRPRRQADRPGERTIEVWHGFNHEETKVFLEIVEEFKAHHRETTGETLHVKVSYVSFNDMFTKLKTAALANITPDIAFMDSIKVTDLAFGQALVKIDELEGFRQRYESILDAREQFVGASFDAGIVNRMGEENLYGIPVQTTCVALFWNREMFRNKAAELRAAGLEASRAPRTWDELLAYSRVLSEPSKGIYGFGMSGSLWFLFPIFNMYGVDFVIYDDEGLGKAALNTPNGRAALERIRQIAQSGVEGGAWKRGGLGPDQGFTNELYAMIMTGPWMVENFTNSGLDFDVSLIPAPSPQEVETLGLEPIEPAHVERFGEAAWTSSNLGGQTGIIMRTSQHADTAYEFLEYFTSEAVQRRWASGLGQIPVRRSAWLDLDTSKYPFLPKFMDQLATSRRIPQVPLFSIMESNIFNPEIDLLLQNPKYPVESMTQNVDRGLDTQILAQMNDSIRRARK